MIDTLAKPASLATRLRERIAREGPITFCDWMRSALYDQADGYYCKGGRTRWGREGDYRTSPERSRLFAGTFAVYFSKLYAALGSPQQWTILECGAGEGHFAAGVLQTLQRSYPSVFAATVYVIDEVSSHSRTLARERLKSFADCVQFKAFDEVEIESGIVFSNELLDAFPVHRITMQGNELCEFYVTLGANGAFEWTIGELDPALTTLFSQDSGELDIQLNEGEVKEVSLEIENWLRKVANRLQQGYVITVDYGVDTSDRRETLRGFYRHQFVDDLLARPGEYDLTASVNWDFVKSVGKRVGLGIVEFERQDKFLLSAGFLEQLEFQSRQSETEAERLGLATSAREMILPDGMAAHFQVLVQQKT
jgi:SAM-dependent MidA family methyltransferase